MKISKQQEIANDDSKIKRAFGTKNPGFAFSCGGMRRIFVDPADMRVRRMLLRKGFRYFSSNQFMVYCLNKLLTVDAFIDVGSNYGECLVSLPLYSKTIVRGFEANPNLLSYIKKTIRFNEDLRDIEIAARAVTNRAGEKVDFQIDTRWSGKSSLSLDPGRSGVVTMSVPTTTIDDEVSALGSVSTLLVKIDVEGHEPDVLQGAVETNNSVQNIIYLLEFDSKFLSRGGHDPRVFFEILSETFALYKMDGAGLHEVPDYASLARGGSDLDEIHVDLVATKFDTPEVRDRFEKKILHPDFSETRRSLWGVL
jgi:FkbM family methyltransferase